MSNYVPTGPWTNGASPGISSGFLNALEQVLKQTSGGSESGHYGIVGNWAGTGVGFVGNYITTISRTTTPISVTIDTADQSPGGNLAAPSTATLTSGGFKAYSSMTNGNNGFCAGNWTVNY